MLHLFWLLFLVYLSPSSVSSGSTCSGLKDPLPGCIQNAWSITDEGTQLQCVCACVCVTLFLCVHNCYLAGAVDTDHLIVLPVLMPSHDVIGCSVGLLSEGTVIPTVTIDILVVLCVAAMTLFPVIVTIYCDVFSWKIHKARQKGKLLISYISICQQQQYCTTVISASHQRRTSPLPPWPAPSDDPTPSGDPTSIQLQPNPSYCSVEMSYIYQQLISSCWRTLITGTVPQL